MNRDAAPTDSLISERMLINNSWVVASGERTFPVECPARRGSVLAEVPLAGPADVDKALDAAVAALANWSTNHWRERSQPLLRIADALEEQHEQLARLLASETGSAIRTQARPEVSAAIEVFRYFGGVAGEVKGDALPLDGRVLSYTRREPWGVVGAIVPWNAPVSLSALKIAPALAAGNVMVLKPSEEAPLSVLALGRICAEFLPPGVLNIITGTGAETGRLLAADERVSKLSFTGGTETGVRLLHQAAERVVPVTLELGGKSPSIVFPDADERAVDGVVDAMRFTRQGQSCTAGSRLLIHESIFERLLDDVTQKLSRLIVGDPLDERTDIGAVNGKRHLDRIARYIDGAMAQQGASLIHGGVPPNEGELSGGYYAEPTVITGISPDSPVAREEVFGPVMIAMPWRDESQVVRMANDTPYGLAAYLFSRDVAKAVSMAHELAAGFILINQGKGAFPGQAFGGYKMSGLGREYSMDGMLESYTQVKNVMINLG